jgi:hypothetical protein
MNSNFNITLRTPFGSQNGVLTLIDDNGTLNGYIRAMEKNNYFKNGSMVDNSFAFSGILDVGIFKFSYTAKGSIVGNVLKAVATTNSGTFQISGTRTTG